MIINTVLSKEYIKQYFSDMKYFILVSTIIFIVSIILGYVFADGLRPLGMAMIQEMVKNKSINDIGFLDILLNNVMVNLLMVVLGVLFSVFTFIILVVNGVLFGFVASLSPVADFLLLTIPHGIFELPALILSASASLMFTKVIIRLLSGVFSKNSTVKDEFRDSKLLFKHILFSIFLIVVLLIIAAFIETYITLGVYYFFVG